MKAMIFAAGTGTRLKPLTDRIPKALVPLENKPILEWVMDKLLASGVTDMVVNVHHHPEQMHAFIMQARERGYPVRVSDETDMLLDTGGGLKKARKWLEGSREILAYNADILSNISLTDMLRTHRESGALATLAVSRRRANRYFLWHKDRLCGWENRLTGQHFYCKQGIPPKTQALAFSGIQVMHPRIFDLMEEEEVFSIRSTYLQWACSHQIRAFTHDARYWADIGSLEKLEKARILYREHREIFDRFT